MTSTAFDEQFAVCTPEEEEAFRAIEARQREAEIMRLSERERFMAWYASEFDGKERSARPIAWAAWQEALLKPGDA